MSIRTDEFIFRKQSPCTAYWPSGWTFWVWISAWAWAKSEIYIWAKWEGASSVQLTLLAPSHRWRRNVPFFTLISSFPSRFNRQTGQHTCSTSLIVSAARARVHTLLFYHLMKHIMKLTITSSKALRVTRGFSIQQVGVVYERLKLGSFSRFGVLNFCCCLLDDTFFIYKCDFLNYA